MTRYTSVSVSNYNASPPTDDGSETAANQLDWDFHIDKIGDPLKTALEGINTNLSTLDGLLFPSGVASAAATSNIAASQNGKLIKTTNTITLTLPAAATAGSDFLIGIKNTDGGTVTVDGNGSETIDGSATITLSDANAVVLLQSDGTNWQILAENIPTGADNTVLKSNGTGKVWGKVDGTEIAFGSDAQGDVYYHNGTDVVRLAAGTDGQVYETQGSGANPQWADRIALGTPQNSTSGTEVDFTSIPAWAKEINILLSGVSFSGTDDILIQIGDSGGVETASYISQSFESNGGTAVATGTSTSGFIVNAVGASGEATGVITLRLMNSSTNLWIEDHSVTYGTAGTSSRGAGSKALSAALDRVRITRTGTDTFDAGSINIQYK